MNAIAHRLTQITMIAAIFAAGVTVLPAHAADGTSVRVVQLQPVTITAKRIRVVELQRVTVTAKRLAPKAMHLAERASRSASGSRG